MKIKGTYSSRLFLTCICFAGIQTFVFAVGFPHESSSYYKNTLKSSLLDSNSIQSYNPSLLDLSEIQKNSVPDCIKPYFSPKYIIVNPRLPNTEYNLQDIHKNKSSESASNSVFELLKKQVTVMPIEGHDVKTLIPSNSVNGIGVLDENVDALSMKHKIFESIKNTIAQLNESLPFESIEKHPCYKAPPRNFNYKIINNESVELAKKQLDSYKEKYRYLFNSELEDSSLRRNSLEDLRFAKRITYGSDIMFNMSKDAFLVINPYLGYRISKILETGIGLSFRINYNLQDVNMVNEQIINFGGRLYFAYSLRRSFWLYCEYEAIKGLNESQANDNRLKGNIHSNINFGLLKIIPLSPNIKIRVSLLYNYGLSDMNYYTFPILLRMGLSN